MARARQSSLSLCSADECPGLALRGDAELQECDKTLLAEEGRGPPWEQGDVVTAHTVIGPYINTAEPSARATAATSAVYLIPYL